MAIEDKIDELRKALDGLIEKNAPYEEIYKLSKELDKYIAQYYRERERE